MLIFDIYAPGTTDPLAPFGVVTLAPSGGEGGADIQTMRWAQTASYGVLPNSALPKTFVAQAYDLNDPFSNITCYKKQCCDQHFNMSVCTRGAANAFEDCKEYCAAGDATGFYMYVCHISFAQLQLHITRIVRRRGPIHPRAKKSVGVRLAQGAAVTAYGSTGPVSEDGN